MAFFDRFLATFDILTPTASWTSYSFYVSFFCVFWRGKIHAFAKTSAKKWEDRSSKGVVLTHFKEQIASFPPLKCADFMPDIFHQGLYHAFAIVTSTGLRLDIWRDPKKCTTFSKSFVRVTRFGFFLRDAGPPSLSHIPLFKKCVKTDTISRTKCFAKKKWGVA